MWSVSNECKLDESLQWFFQPSLCSFFLGNTFWLVIPWQKSLQIFQAFLDIFFSTCKFLNSVHHLFEFSIVNPYFSLFLKYQKSFKVPCNKVSRDETVDTVSLLNSDKKVLWSSGWR